VPRLTLLVNLSRVPHSADLFTEKYDKNNFCSKKYCECISIAVPPWGIRQRRRVTAGTVPWEGGPVDVPLEDGLCLP
jgi:hypothetical protein